MSIRRFITAVILALLVFGFTRLKMDEASAQGACPTTGTYGKDVGRDFFSEVVGLLKDVPQSDFAVDVLMAWKPHEGTKAFWNPLATTWKMSPVCDFNSVGVQNYVDEGTGVRATANTLNLAYYDSIRSMLRLEAFDREAIRSALGKWGTCTGAACDTLLSDWQGLYNNYRNNPPVGTTTTSTILVFDTSGSMADPDASGVLKLDAAKGAGNKLLDVIGAENGAGVSAGNKAAIVDFSNNASVDMQPTTDIAATERALSGLTTTGGTAMPKGLKAALDLFPSPTTDKSFIILLTDGLPNIGLNDEQDEATARQQVLDLATQSGQRGICIYTVGFGDPASATIDEDFLKQVASNSVCGSYHNAANSWELANIYINLRHTSTGTTLLSQSGSINQDQLLDVGSVQVPDNQSMMLLTLNWPGSQLDAILKDPSGQLVDKNYPGASVTLTDTLASIIIQNPRAGQWNVSAKGINVPEGTTTYNAVLSVRPNLIPPTTAAPPTPALPSSGGFPFAIITVVLVAFGVVVYTMTLTAKRYARGVTPVQVAPASIVALNGTFTGRAIPLRDGMLIGRSSVCALRLDDPSVSRRHAQLRYAGGRWYIQDLKSQTGVQVNGGRVQAAALQRGDRIRIGSMEFIFN